MVHIVYSNAVRGWGRGGGTGERQTGLGVAEEAGAAAGFHLTHECLHALHGGKTAPHTARKWHTHHTPYCCVHIPVSA